MGALELIRSRVLVRIGDRLDGRLSGRLFAAVFRQSLAGAPGRQALSYFMKPLTDSLERAFRDE